MAHKNRTRGRLAKAAAAVGIVMAILRFIRLLQDETEPKKPGKSRLANNLPKITAGVALFLSIMRFIRVFRSDTEVEAE